MNALPAPASPIAVVGWGRSGQGAAGALASRGFDVRAFDAKGGGPLHFDEAAGVPVSVEADAGALADLVVGSGPAAVVVSPGVPPRSPVFARARAAGIEVWGEVELAWRLQEAGPHAGRPWLCVTGTNGKTTTVGMLGEILRAGGADAVEVGNIGTPITRAIDSAAGVFAVELSSFQLHTTRSVSPLASICLNVDADHLDWHGSAEAYAADKARVYENTVRACVYPASDRRVERMVEDADVVEGARAIGLALGAPSVSQLGIVEGLLVDRAFVEDRAHHALALAHVSDLSAAYGPHPSAAALSDALAAAALARAYGVEAEAVEEGLRSFRPAGHRRAIVGHAADLTWIDDSKATNAHAAHASLAGLPPRSAVWIVGGDAKGQDFHDLIRAVEPVLHGVVVIGRDRSALAAALDECAPGVPRVEVDGHEDWMSSVVNEAVALSVPGNTVVLAPACASWDQFENYARRGEAFADAVRRLAAQWGGRP